jgi:hypothetical protein
MNEAQNIEKALFLDIRAGMLQISAALVKYARMSGAPKSSLLLLALMLDASAKVIAANLLHRESSNK